MNEIKETPSFIKALLLPTATKAAARKVWSIDLEAVWLPLFTATNVMGDTHLPSEALGAPIRLGYGEDGAVKFSKTGRPVTKVVKELADSIRLVRENFTAGLVNYSAMVAQNKPEAFKAEIAGAIKAGQPIHDKDTANLAKALAKAVTEAEAIIANAPPAAATPPAATPPADPHRNAAADKGRVLAKA